MLFKNELLAKFDNESPDITAVCPSVIVRSAEAGLAENAILEIRVNTKADEIRFTDFDGLCTCFPIPITRFKFQISYLGIKKVQPP